MNEMILIVEDEAIVAMEIEARLRRLGYGIAGCVSSGEEALRLAGTQSPDLVLMDIRLAGDLDGIGTAAHIRERYNLPVVYLTAYADEPTLQRAKLTEPYGYLVKPFEEIELRTTLEVALYKHRLEKRLSESERRYRLLFENAGDAIFIIEAEGAERGRIVDANRAAAEMHGSSVEEMRTLRITDLDSPDDADKSAALIERILAGEWIRREIRHRRRDGTLFPVEISAGLLAYEGRKYILAFDRDITERQHAEADLRLALAQAKEEKLKTDAIIAGMGDGISIQARDYTVLYQNEVHRGLIGEHVGERCYRAYERRDSVCEGCPLEASFQDGKVHRAERSGASDRGAVHVEISASPIRDSSGRIVAGIEIARDVSTRRQAEEERKQLIRELQEALRTISRSQQEWQATFDSISDMIVIYDDQCRVIKANLAFAVFVKRDIRDVVNRTCDELLDDAEHPLLRCVGNLALSDGCPATEEVRDAATGRVFLVSVFPFALPERSAPGTIHVLRDVTDEREREMRLIMSERLASLGQMASGIAHEINNPLASIVGCSEALVMRLAKGEMETEIFRRYLGIIQEEVFRCKEITTAMLSFVRQNTYDKKSVRLGEILDKALEVIGFQGRLRAVEVVRNVAGDAPPVHASEGEIRQVFLAVISNALDAMQEKGRLTVGVRAENEGVAVTISDTGPGIEPEHLGKVFTPFFTTKLEHGGTGLGLAIARRIVLDHRGELDISSEPGRGTTVMIFLPL